MVLISCDFFLRSLFNIFEGLWTVFNKLFVPGTYLTDPIPCDVSLGVRFKFLEESYWACRTVFHKYFMQDHI